MKILGIETSSHCFSLCLMEDQTLVTQVMRNRTHDPSSRDARFFDEAQALFGIWKPEHLDAIAISIGPGMFTSLRIGLSLAKGIAFAHGTPVTAVNTLDAMGNAQSVFPGTVGVVVNAFHKELYAALYDRGTCRSGHMLIKLEDSARHLAAAALIIGPGVPLLEDTGYFQCPPGRDQDRRHLFPAAEDIVRGALSRISAGDFDAFESLEPYYIKRTDAERLHDTKDDLSRP